eukprot:TRINITY_DN1716_c1_g4_i1.p1 TRINITY_DN1716_c1_g4~~TRINITY_DN1716_c1_g4_i1.p1  ORF type:complete len:129 (+),score=9.61 TRINITY_DN1716_c1_g4_i1:226-612(+)
MNDKLHISEIKAFIPALDYELSKEFYKTIGFTQASDFDGVAYFYRGECSFLLQDFYVKEHCENFVLHILVTDINSWYTFIKEKNVEQKFKTTISEIKKQPWNMYEFILTDPSGVLLRISQNITKEKND